MIDEFKDWFERLWFLRGVLATLTLLGMIAEYFGMTDWEFARFTHALIWSWNDTLDQIGAWITAVLRLPKIDASILNSLLFVVITMSPLMIQMIRSEDEEFALHKKVIVSKAIKIPMFLVGIGLMASVVWMVMFGFDEDGVRFVDRSEFRNPSEAYFGALFLPLAYFALAIITVKGFGRGILYALSVIATLEIVYFLPFIGDQMSNFADKVLGNVRRAD